MRTYPVVVESMGREFYHGEVKAEGDFQETKLELDVQLVVVSEDLTDFREDLEKLIAKYAI